MGLKLRNLNKSLEFKVSKCIALLDDEYRALDFTIDFYKNRERLKQEQKNNPEMSEEQYKQILSGENSTSGITISDLKKIKIFLFLYDKKIETKPSEIILLIGNIYHELRHAWQATNNLYTDEPEISTIDGSFEDYLRLPSEKDAYIFQEEQLDKYQRKILENFGYTVNGEIPPFRLLDYIREIVYS